MSEERRQKFPGPAQCGIIEITLSSGFSDGSIDPTGAMLGVHNPPVPRKKL
jgi:hypothetical protein